MTNANVGASPHITVLCPTCGHPASADFVNATSDAVAALTRAEARLHLHCCFQALHGALAREARRLRPPAVRRVETCHIFREGQP